MARVLKEAGCTTEPEPIRPHPDVPRRFERARPNQLWQTDLFSFMLKRQNRRVYLVGFIDDHSRFMVGYGVWASAPTALVIEVFRAAVGSYRAPEEVLTDNGPQYVTWRGKSAFSRELERQGVKHLVALAEGEPKPVGRPRNLEPAPLAEAEAARLEAENKRLRVELEVAYVREELRLGMPQLFGDQKKRRFADLGAA